MRSRRVRDIDHATAGQIVSCSGSRLPADGRPYRSTILSRMREVVSCSNQMELGNDPARFARSLLHTHHVSFANAEEFYVVKNPATHRCRVVTQPPRNQRIAMFEGTSFSPEEAFARMRTSSSCQENGIDGVSQNRTAGDVNRPPLL
jgi:hypothetical protein